MNIILADALGRGLTLEPEEAIAVVQQLIHKTPYPGVALSTKPGRQKGDDQVAEPASEHLDPGPEHIEIGSDGHVACTALSGPPSVTTAATLLQKLLVSTHRVPGGLRYAVGRALHEVEGKSIDFLDELSAALARYERGDRRDVVRALAIRLAAGIAAPDARPATPVARERRSVPEAVFELRRQLRDADRALFEHSVDPAQPSGSPLGSDSPASRTTPRIWMPTMISGLAAGMLVALAGEAVHVYRDRSAPAAAVPTAPVLASPAAASDAERQALNPSGLQPVTEPGPVSQAGPVQDARERREAQVAPKSVETGGPRDAVNGQETVKRPVHRVQTAGTGHIRHTPATHPQKTKRRRLFGLPFFVSDDFALRAPRP